MRAWHTAILIISALAGAMYVWQLRYQATGVRGTSVVTVPMPPGSPGEPEPTHADILLPSSGTPGVPPTAGLSPVDLVPKSTKRIALVLWFNVAYYRRLDHWRRWLSEHAELAHGAGVIDTVVIGGPEATYAGERKHMPGPPWCEKQLHFEWQHCPGNLARNVHYWCFARIIARLVRATAAAGRAPHDGYLLLHADAMFNLHSIFDKPSTLNSTAACAVNQAMRSVRGHAVHGPPPQGDWGWWKYWVGYEAMAKLTADTATRAQLPISAQTLLWPSAPPLTPANASNEAAPPQRMYTGHAPTDFWYVPASATPAFLQLAEAAGQYQVFAEIGSTTILYVLAKAFHMPVRDTSCAMLWGAPPLRGANLRGSDMSLQTDSNPRHAYDMIHPVSWDAEGDVSAALQARELNRLCPSESDLTLTDARCRSCIDTAAAGLVQNITAIIGNAGTEPATQVLPLLAAAGYLPPAQ